MSPTITNEQVEGVVGATLVSLGAPAEAISHDASFEALDVDSLDLVELAQVIEDEFGVQLKGNDVKDIATIGDLVELVISRA
jgi:acyl carrier protein